MLANLKTIREEHGLTRKKVASDLGVALGTYRNWEQGVNEPRMASDLMEIANYFGVSVEDLFIKGNPVSSDLPAGAIQAVGSSAYTEVPVLGSIAAGAHIDIEQWSGKTCPIPDEILWRHPRAFLLEVCGDSMNKYVLEGSYALIDPDLNDTELVDGKIVAVNVNGHDATLKRVKKLSNAVLLMPESHSPEHEVVVIDFNDPDVESLRIIGQMIWDTKPKGFRY